jgi:N6-adenosine-specific RNA methylase IME4
VGVSARTLGKIKELYAAAKAGDENAKKLLALVDSKQKTVNGAYNKWKQDAAAADRPPLPPLPEEKYQCIIVDPPWDVKKILRDERPNQAEFDYTTMADDEIRALPVPDLAADGCHLYLWTTHKKLPAALKIAEAWGFKYQCLMTWVKNVGFTPFSWMYSTEHVLFCRKGKLDLLKMGVRLDFSAPVREHSRKPDVFYETVAEVSPGPILEMFSREDRAGFVTWGNETAKFTADGDGVLA